MYRKKGRGWTKHIDFMLLDIVCIQIAFIVSYVLRFGMKSPYTDNDYRTLAVAFLLIDFFVEIVSDSFKNVLKRGYFDEFTATCKHVILVEVVTTFYLFTTQMGDIYSRASYYIMIPFYVVIAYAGRVILKRMLKKKGFGATKNSLLVIAPKDQIEEALKTVTESSIGYVRIIAAATDADLKGKKICDIEIVANHDEIIDYACSEWVDEVLIMLYFMFFSKECIYFISGKAYEDAIIPMQIIMPTLLFIGLTNILGIQILVPLGREKTVLISVVFGACIDIFVNLLLIPHCASVGAAVGTVIAELSVLIIQAREVIKENSSLFDNIHLKNILCALLIATVLSLWIKFLNIGLFLTLLFSGVLFGGIYVIYLLIRKEKLVVEIFNVLSEKLHKVI